MARAVEAIAQQRVIYSLSSSVKKNLWGASGVFFYIFVAESGLLGVMVPLAEGMVFPKGKKMMLKMTSAALALAASCFLFAPANAAPVSANHGLVGISKSFSGATEVARKCRIKRVRRCHLNRYHHRVCRVIVKRDCHRRHHHH
jgi:hypothetical protein